MKFSVTRISFWSLLLMRHLQSELALFHLAYMFIQLQYLMFSASGTLYLLVFGQGNHSSTCTGVVEFTRTEVNISVVSNIIESKFKAVKSYSGETSTIEKLQLLGV